MYLKKLSIQGFKSFATATEINFDPGITAIVGPNGCGKSNIVDALRWVIGEQRARVLRSDKMDSIIFNGTAHRRAVGLAEVQLTIANTRGVLPVEYSEVVLGRRLYRSGEAEYLLNGVSCRLRDITDLFTDTGMGAGAYSVIELKMIDEILSENTQDRRRLFEEASGITRYKKRRTDALRKLDHMQSDLARVQDLTDEISARVRSLKRQAGIAERYLRYKTELRAAQIELLKVDYAQLVTEENILADEVTRISDTCAGLTAKVHTSETQLEDLQARFLVQEKRAKINRQEFVDYEQRVIKLEGDLKLEEVNRQTLSRNLEKLAEERKAVDEELRNLDVQEESVHSSLAAAVSEANRATKVFDQTASERTTVQTQLKTLEQEGEVLGAAVQNLNQKKVDVQRQTDQLYNRISHLKEEDRRLETEWNSENETNQDATKAAAQALVALEKVKKKRDHVRRERQAAETSHAVLQKKITDAESSVQLAEKQLAAKQAEIRILEDLVSTYDFFPDAVRYLLTNAQDLQITTLSDLISCLPENRAALAASLEPYGGCIVAETEEIARMAARQLRSEDVGRAYFIILENIPSCPPAEIRPDALLSHISLQAEIYRPIAHLLLRDVLLVDSLDTALDLLKQEGGQARRYVTLDGEWVDGRGMLYAGGSEEGGAYSHLARRDSLRAAGEAYQEFQKQAKQAQKVLTEVRNMQDQLDLSGIINRVRTAEESYAEADRAAQRQIQIRDLGSAQLGTISRRRQELAQEIDQLKRKAEPGGDRLNHLDQQLAQVREDVKSMEDKIQAEREKLDQMQNAYVNANTVMVQAVASRERLEADVQRIEQEKFRLNTRAIRHFEEQAALKERKADSRGKVRQLTERLKAEHSCRTHWEEVRKKDSSQEHEIRIELEQTNERVRKARRALQEATQEETGTRVRYSAVQTRREDLLRRAVEDHGVEFSQTPNIDEVGDDTALREKIQETERKLRSMGNVNALALEEYEKQNERLEFMLAQRADLEEAEQTLVRTIKEINSTASRQFLDTYALIQENFQKIFCELFGDKARCELDLTTPEDVLESPISVTARPSGKRPVSIAQLSSGEKTLTAIALLFAIYLIKPSPFCFLDEVDAPLDDINVDHFMRIIQRFSSDTQFVLVTHNKRTMEMANCLYGVTMQEEGVSSLVSVRFDEAIAMGNGH